MELCIIHTNSHECILRTMALTYKIQYLLTHQPITAYMSIKLCGAHSREITSRTGLMCVHEHACTCAYMHVLSHCVSYSFWYNNPRIYIWDPRDDDLGKSKLQSVIRDASPVSSKMRLRSLPFPCIAFAKTNQTQIYMKRELYFRNHYGWYF